jgi:hypothetical protein
MKMKSKREIAQGKGYTMPQISDKTVHGILKHPKFFRGHIRTSAGKIYKTGEFEERSDRVLGMRMP